MNTVKVSSNAIIPNFVPVICLVFYISDLGGFQATGLKDFKLTDNNGIVIVEKNTWANDRFIPGDKMSCRFGGSAFNTITAANVLKSCDS